MEDLGHPGIILPSRILRRIDYKNGHWLWTGQLNRNGYARIWWDGKMRVAHRVVWEQIIGPIPNGLLLDHVKERCTFRHCVCFRCLEPVTPLENTLRGKAILYRRCA
jgi:hypothetical protein